MTTRITKLALLSTASAAAAAFALPGAAFAQNTTTCTVSPTDPTVFNCADGTTGVTTVVVTNGTFTGTAPLTISSSTGNISATSTPVANGGISNSTAGQSAVTLNNTFAGGSTTFTATGQNITSAGTGATLTSSGGPVTFTSGNITAVGTGITSTGSTTGNITTGNIGVTGVGATAVTQSGSGDQTLSTGSVTSTGTGVTLTSTGGNASLTSTGRITGATGGVSLTGVGTSFTGAGVTTTDGPAVVTAGTTGTTTIRSGSVQAANGVGISATSTTGAVDIGNCPTVATTGASATGIAATTTTGNITVNCGAVTTAGAGSDGVNLTSTSGNVNVTTTSVNTGNFAGSNGVVIATEGTVTGNVGTVTTAGADSAGVLITGAGGSGAVNLGFGNITTSGTGASNALDITSTGTVNLTGTGSTLRTEGAGVTAAVINGAGVTGNLGNVTTTGAGSAGAVITSTAPVNLTVGTVNTTGDALTINAGANNVTLTTGAVTATEAGSNGTEIISDGTVVFNGGVQTANGGTAFRIRGDAQSVNATIAGAATTGDNAEAVLISASGPVTFTNSGTITTTGRNATGVLIDGGGATTANVTCGNISTTGVNADAFSLTANGDTTVTCGTITTTGAGSDGINVENGAGTTTVTGTSTTVSGEGSIGIDVATGGTGGTTVNTGTVTSTGAGVADPSFAAVRVVNVGNGAVNVVATGNVSAASGSGIFAQSDGPTSVTVNQGVTVQGPSAVTFGAGAGARTLTVNGTIRSTGAAGSPAFTLIGGGPFTLNVGSSGSIQGALTFTDGNDTFNNAGNFTQTGTIDFLAGDDTFNNTGTFTHGGIVQFGDGNDTLTNSGTLNLSSAAAFDFGAGTDTFTNSGTLNLRDGAQTLAGLETFTNAAGLIDLRDGAANDVLTIPGNYAATGNARLGIDIVGANNALTTDRLVIGGTVTGSTSILGQFSGQQVVNTTGVLVVDTAGTTLAANAFTLGGVTDAGFLNFSLETRGGDVFLVSRPDALVADQLFVGRLANDIWYQSFDAYHAYALSRRIEYGNERRGPVGIWAQLYGSQDRVGDRDRAITVFGTNLTTSNRFETDRRGAQVGLDFGAQNFVAGITAGYERAEGDSDLGTGLTLEGYNYGAYAQFGAEQGLYAGVLIKRDDFDIRVANNGVGLGVVNPEGRSTGIDGEVGFRFGNPGGINFDVGAGLSYVRTSLDDFTFGNIGFESDRYTSTRGRLQARATFAGTLAPFIDGKIFREFGDEAEFTLRSGTSTSSIVDAGRGTWGRIEAGLGGGVGGGPLISGWADLGDVRGYGVRVGFRF